MYHLWPRRTRRGYLCASRAIQSAERRGCSYVTFTAPLSARYALPSPPIATGAHYGGFRLVRAQVRRLFRPCGRPWRPTLRDFVESVARVYLQPQVITHLCQIAAFRHSFKARDIALQNPLQVIEPHDLAAKITCLAAFLCAPCVLCARAARAASS